MTTPINKIETMFLKLPPKQYTLKVVDKIKVINKLMEKVSMTDNDNINSKWLKK